MNYEPEPFSDQQVDAYLDGLMQPHEREDFLVSLRAHPELANKVRLQTRIDNSLKLLFPREQLSEQQLKEILAAIPPSHVLASRQSRLSRALRIAAVGLAAALAWIIVASQMQEPRVEAPFFEPRPVALVYQEVVENGFEPYYECREADRFAATFLHRQGQALQLAPLPAGSRMLGLSYAGGLSRETTAMLCEVDGQPVMVFVDRLANDLPIAAQLTGNNLHVHRVARDGLVFYEVTPFETSRVIEYLLPQAAVSNG